MAATTAHDRVYGYRHKQLRRQWAPAVAGGRVACARCGRLIAPGAPWDLGHVDADPTQRTYRGPEHRFCSRSAGGKKGRRGTPRRARWW